MANNTVKARVQLKNDTEVNWNKATHFIPLKGEVIIYSADNTHPFCRMKIGDGVTTVIDLPFFQGEIPKDFIPQKLGHSITFGAHEQYTFDGSRDVTVPVYPGTII